MKTDACFRTWKSLTPLFSKEMSSFSVSLDSLYVAPSRIADRLYLHAQNGRLVDRDRVIKRLLVRQLWSSKTVMASDISCCTRSMRLEVMGCVLRKDGACSPLDLFSRLPNLPSIDAAAVGLKHALAISRTPMTSASVSARLRIHLEHHQGTREGALP